jgi:hypothetical protein
MKLANGVSMENIQSKIVKAEFTGASLKGKRSCKTASRLNVFRAYLLETATAMQ